MAVNLSIRPIQNRLLGDTTKCRFHPQPIQYRHHRHGAQLAKMYHLPAAHYSEQTSPQVLDQLDPELDLKAYRLQRRMNNHHHHHNLHLIHEALIRVSQR